MLVSTVLTLNNTYIGNPRGDWFNKNNWGLGRVPICSDTVYIMNNYVISGKDGRICFRRLEIENSIIDINNNYNGDIKVHSNSIVHFSGVIGESNIESNGTIIIDKKCENNGNIKCGKNSNILLNYGGSINVNGSITSDNTNIIFDSIDTDHWEMASNIHSNRIVGNYTLDVKRYQKVGKNEKFCWTILSGNYIVGNYRYENREYNNSRMIRQDIYIWVCFENYDIACI